MRRGVTLVEMLVVVAIVGLIAGISFPAVSSGLDSIRLQSAADSVAAFLNSAMNHAERRLQVVEVVIEPKRNRLVLYSTEPSFERELEMPQNVAVIGEEERRFLLMPGGSIPRITVDLANVRGARKRITILPVSGVPSITALPAPA